MIISVSRRCDIPAFSGDRFMKELHGGETVVRSPFRPGPGRRVSLKREDVDAFVFWSRDPRPFMGHLPGIDRGGYPYYFLITLTGYPRVLEPAVPAVDDALPFFRELAARLGRRRVVWRYDPVIFTPATPPAFHAENFSRLAFLLAPYASRAIVSFFDPYPKALRRLRQAGIDGSQAAGSVARQRDFLARCAAVASAAGLEIQTCAEPDLGAGITPGKCVDEGLLNEIFGLSLSYRKDPSQRKLCRCSQSLDIGSYGACRHGCLYCYAR
jgi:hypothetical protein